MINYLPKPRHFILQWHITERCNWNCKHCYQNKNYIKEELNTEQLFGILKQYIFLIKKWNLSKFLSRINITGGEPFVRKDFFKLAEKLGSHSNLFHWGILSNGSFITKDIAKKLKSFNIFRYQVSLEGLKETNEKIRGKGTFKKVINAIKLLVDAEIAVRVSLTLTKKNVKDIPALAELLDKLGVCHLGTRRLIPCGKGSALSDSLLEPKELRAYYKSVVEMNKNLRRKNSQLRVTIGCESGIFNDELPNNSHKKSCGVIDGRILIVMPNGDVLPCRRLPIVINNVLKQNLFEIYYTSNKLWELRNRNNAHPFCRSCKNFQQCFGGAKCVTYCYSNKLFIPDIQCWKFYKNLKKPEFFDKLKEDIKKELVLCNVSKNAK